ncbi:hypothetical protein ANCCAN_09789 [Ancylostoma caninum]|uniref:Uncharacterized protein n=1 Tax=Ancylostoma caninum TaxID=29170 RepID=A0A368GIK1_ANCCA|nr:hypothetical protein ANCCAN_09789 [Ancylostoma caninum]
MENSRRRVLRPEKMPKVKVTLGIGMMRVLEWIMTGAASPHPHTELEGKVEYGELRSAVDGENILQEALALLDDVIDTLGPHAT